MGHCETYLSQGGVWSQVIEQAGLIFARALAIIELQDVDFYYRGDAAGVNALLAVAAGQQPCFLRDISMPIAASRMSHLANLLLAASSLISAGV